MQYENQNTQTNKKQQHPNKNFLTSRGKLSFAIQWEQSMPAHSLRGWLIPECSYFLQLLLPTCLQLASALARTLTSVPLSKYSITYCRNGSDYHTQKTVGSRYGRVRKNCPTKDKDSDICVNKSEASLIRADIAQHNT